jgi:hypothetical protein
MYRVPRFYTRVFCFSIVWPQLRPAVKFKVLFLQFQIPIFVNHKNLTVMAAENWKAVVVTMQGVPVDLTPLENYKPKPLVYYLTQTAYDAGKAAGLNMSMYRVHPQIPGDPDAPESWNDLSYPE